MRYHSVNIIENKRLGAFYTPQGLAESLAHWAVKSGEEFVLEPSVGGGALLRAAVARANTLSHGQNKLTGVACDIDHRATAALSRQYRGSFSFVTADFLSLEPSNFAKFDVVLANPPFTRNHSIEKVFRGELRKRFGIFGAAGIWVAFLLHARKFLKPGGRIISIVPRSALFTDYGRRFVQAIREEFSDLNLAPICGVPQWSGGADERGAVLIAEGYRELPSTRSTWGGCTVSFEGLPAEKEPNVMSELREYSTPLDALASLSIGAVTGRNAVFLLNESERLEFGIELDQVRPIISRSAQIVGLRVVRANLEKLARRGHKTWLLAPTKLSAGVRRRLDLVTDEERMSVAWLNKREPWWQIDCGADCEAIFTYMNDMGPTLALTAEGIACTNTLHKVVFRSGVLEEQKRSASLTLLTSFGALASETMGRQYGGGLLKFELSDARKLPMLASAMSCRDAFWKAHAALLRGQKEEARAIANNAILRPLLGKSWKAGCSELDEALISRRAERRNSKMNQATK